MGTTDWQGRVLVTGATGQTGWPVAEKLLELGVSVSGAATNPDRARAQLGDAVNWVRLDFLDPSTYDAALEGVDRIYLMRPPMLSKPSQLEPFIRRLQSGGIRHIVFLSLLGIEKNPFPPHAKIEKQLQATGIPYTFLRPSFFMQNLLGPHQEDLRDRSELFVPAGNTPVSFIDTRDLGEAAARILAASATEEGLAPHRNRAYDLTGPAAITYGEAADMLTRVLERRIVYPKPHVLAFYRRMRKQGHKRDYVTVMSVLYLLTRMGMAKKVTGELEELLGRPPRPFEVFAQDYADAWRKK